MSVTTGQPAKWHRLFIGKSVSLFIVDQVATGKEARRIRELKCCSLREVAATIGGVSAMYLCDLENGKRGWNGRKATRYADWVVNNTTLRHKKPQVTKEGAKHVS
jgi:hypothetical protein